MQYKEAKHRTDNRCQTERNRQDRGEITGFQSGIERNNPQPAREDSTTDRNQEDPEGEANEIAYAWTKQSVDTIQHICLALDELVTERISQFPAIRGADI